MSAKDSNTVSSSINSTALSSTALYTAYVWQHNNLATIQLAQSKGFLYYQLLRPFNWLARTIKGVDLETILLQRHQIIDSILEREIESGRIKQVVELAAGFSPRGSSFVSRYGASHQLQYIETDLAPQIAMKKSLIIEKSKVDEKRHFFIPVDAFAKDGFAELKKTLDPNLGTAIISEGLLNYFSTEQVSELWIKIQDFLSHFSTGIYLADTQTRAESFDHPLAKMIVSLIRQASKSPFYHHYSGADELKTKLLDFGFSKVEIIMPKDKKESLHLPGTSQKDMVNIIFAQKI
jgi:O-methyltransferase involved in polyketide biosynthesis